MKILIVLLFMASIVGIGSLENKREMNFEKIVTNNSVQEEPISSTVEAEIISFPGSKMTE